MQVSVEINGRRYLIEIDKETDSPDQIIVNGRKVPVNVGPNWANQFVKSLIVDDKSHKLEFEYEESGIPKRVWVDGLPSLVQIDFPGKGKIHGGKVASTMGASKDKVIAPIPGKIVDVRVEKGQEVTEGQVLVVLEAMKMENELSAGHDAVVKQILCKEGDNVELDQVLINLG